MGAKTATLSGDASSSKPAIVGLESEAHQNAALDFIKVLYNVGGCGPKHGITFSVRNCREDGGKPWRDLGTKPVHDAIRDFAAFAPLLAEGGYITVNPQLPFMSDPGKPSLHWNRKLAALGFHKPARRVQYVTGLTAIAIDFDLYKYGLDRHEVQAAVNAKAESIGLPVGMWLYAMGLRALWPLESEDGSGPIKAYRGRTGTIAQWRLWTAALIEILEEGARERGLPCLGIDEAASKNPAQTIRIPGSVSTKDFQRVTHTINKDGGRVPRYKPSTLNKRLGVSSLKRRKKVDRTLKTVANPKASKAVRDANASGPIIHALRVLRCIEALMAWRFSDSIQEGTRHFACYEFGQALHAASWAAKVVLERGWQDLPKVEALYTVEDLVELEALNPMRIRFKVEAFAVRNCAPGRGVDKRKAPFRPDREAEFASARAGERSTPSLVKRSTALLAERLQVTSSEAEALAREFGGRPWRVPGALGPRDRKAAERRAKIRTLLAEAGPGGLSQRELRSRLTDADGKTPGVNTVRADLRAMGIL